MFRLFPCLTPSPKQLVTDSSQTFLYFDCRTFTDDPERKHVPVKGCLSIWECLRVEDRRGDWSAICTGGEGRKAQLVMGLGINLGSCPYLWLPLGVQDIMYIWEISSFEVQLRKSLWEICKSPKLLPCSSTGMAGGA